MKILDNCSTTNETKSQTTTSRDLRDFYIGLGLAMFSTIFIGSSFIFKKKALRRLADKGTRAGDGGLGYLKDWVWWTGMTLMAFGEAANFTAYAFAPATMVTPLGALSVIVTAILSSYFLQERLNLLGKIGCLICLTGSTVVVLHAPKDHEVESLQELSEKLTNPAFLLFAFAILISAIFLIFYISPRYGTTNPMVFVAISGTIGSLSVMWCKGLGVAIKGTISGSHNELSNWLTWFILIMLIGCISVQMNFLNRALDIFNTSVVTPILYVFFTTFVIIASVILFQEWRIVRPEDFLGIVVGFITIVSGIFLLNAFKDMDISWATLKVNVQRDKSAPAFDGVDNDEEVWFDRNKKSIPYLKENNSNSLRNGFSRVYDQDNQEEVKLSLLNNMESSRIEDSIDNFDDK